MSGRCPPGTYDKYPDRPNPTCLKKVPLHPRLQGGITRRRKHRKSKKSRKTRKH
jgi:hypothetical protein